MSETLPNCRRCGRPYTTPGGGGYCEDHRQFPLCTLCGGSGWDREWERFCMLTPRELARAQGFPDSYVLEGTKEQQIARVGNSVVPQVAAAIVRANLGLEACVA